MEAEAMKAFGSGWVWLGYNKPKRKLEVILTSGAGNPLSDNITPILAIDMWEHAYYLDYQPTPPAPLPTATATAAWGPTPTRPAQQPWQGPMNEVSHYSFSLEHVGVRSASRVKPERGDSTDGWGRGEVEINFHSTRSQSIIRPHPPATRRLKAQKIESPRAPIVDLFFRFLAARNDCNLTQPEPYWIRHTLSLLASSTYLSRNHGVRRKKSIHSRPIRKTGGG